MAASALSPPEVPMELHAHNRDKLVRALRDNLAASSRPTRGFVLLQGGEEQTRYCTDHAELFRFLPSFAPQESYFAYLFGVREPGFFGAFDVASGKSFLFVPRLPADYAVWLGEIKPPSFFKEMNKFDTDLSTLHPILTECRVIKSKMELDLIQYANDVSSEAHIEVMHFLILVVFITQFSHHKRQYTSMYNCILPFVVMRRIRSGMKEYQLESIFLHHVYMYGGCRHCSYTCICATGENRCVLLLSIAVLHYGHAAAPNDRILEEGDMALFDMGAEYHFYGSDITCSFPVRILLL
ncbi:hypothetical protein B296_00040707 [Ensete ventricosum]|uniref:Xaa-Pro dipeptidase n=1 Tax=Ensete ventricosum TaxID=4639 RepID=A0A426ZLX5_ENSVE|nr:hypothetical protein B296_00040707 [Ensete ventricosum]